MSSSSPARRPTNASFTVAAAAATAVAAALAPLPHATALAAGLPGGIAVERIGGTAAFGTGATPGDTSTQLPLFVDTFSPSASGGSATPQSTLALPTVDDSTSGNLALTDTASGAGGTPFAEGIMQASPNGKFLVVPGYGLASSSKVIAAVNVSSGTVDSRVSLNASVGPRAATTVDGSAYWFMGSGNGVRYVTLNSPPTTPYTATTTAITATNLNQRTVEIFGGQLFVSGASSVGKSGSSASQPGVAALGTGIPTSGTNTQTYLFTTNSNPEQFAFVDLNPSVSYVNGTVDTGLDTCYVATDSGVEKWTFNGSSWSQSVLSAGLGANSKLTTSMVGVTYAGKDAAGHPILYGTTSGNNSNTGQPEGNALVRLVDDGSSAWSVVAFSPDNTWFRGVQLVKAPGDANMDWSVSRDDLALIDRGFARYQSGAIPANQAQWTDGDFNYDGTITSADYLIVDQAFLASGAAPGDLLAQRESQFGSTYVQELLSSVPEPTSLSLLALTATPLLTRRRSRHA